MKRIFLFIFAIAAIINCNAQIHEPIKWQNDFKVVSDTEAQATFKATIDDTWHLYSTNLPEGGPSATSVTWDTLEGVELVGELIPSRPAHEEVDMLFSLKLGWWEKEVTLTQKFKVTDAKKVKVSGHINFMGCNDGTCLPPAKAAFDFSNGAAAEETAVAAPKMKLKKINDNGSIDIWSPVETATPKEQSASSGSFLYIFIGGFLGGLLALLTPCVWPMIPLTVSFFLKKSGSRAKSIRDAVIYGIAIIVIYLLLGIFITLAFGAGSLNELSTNAIFNIIFFLMLVVFAISFFGAFDITLPNSWANKMDSKASNTTGLLSIFFMAFTLTLVSFSCTGPIIGTLLVEAASLGDITGPVIGMFAFALALAIPFSIFAIFPSWLKSMPKSGGWLNTVKVVLGFIELALSLKFLSVADLAYGWRILDREVFLSLWIVIFALLGLYLLGKIRFPHDGKTESTGVFRFFLALISLSFSVYLLPGLWGAPLKSVSAFAPPLFTQDFNLYEGGKFHEFDNYEEGMAFAQKHDMPVFLDFSGHGCTNCRKMEGAIFDNSEVKDILEKNFVMIKLMVDDRTNLKTPETVVENGKEIELETVGERWSYLQRSKFAANSQPYYVVLDNAGQLLSGPYYYNEDVELFKGFLQKGIDNSKK